MSWSALVRLLLLMAACLSILMWKTHLLKVQLSFPINHRDHYTGHEAGGKMCVTANNLFFTLGYGAAWNETTGARLFTRGTQFPMELVPSVLLPHAQPWLCYMCCAGTGNKRSGNCSAGTPEIICKWGQILHVLPTRKIKKRLRGWKPAGGRCAIALLPCA